MFENLDNDPNPSEEEILTKVSFIKIKDSECGMVGWKYELELPGLIFSSNRTFDSLPEAIEEFMQSRTREL